MSSITFSLRIRISRHIGADWTCADARRPTVASMSLGGSASLSIDVAVRNLVRAGVTVSVASGNSNDDACNQSPARARDVSTHSLGRSQTEEGVALRE